MTTLDQNPTSDNLCLLPDKNGIFTVKYKFVGGHVWEHQFVPRELQYRFPPEPPSPTSVVRHYERDPRNAAGEWALTFAPFVEFLPTK